MKIDISVVIMTFNEQETLPGVIEEIGRALRKENRLHEMIIVDDGSADGTGEMGDQLAAITPNTRIVHHFSNRGLGGVYRTGFREAKGEYITFFPADGQFPADIIHKFFPLMNDADLVLGYLPDRKDPMLSRFLSKAEKALLALLFGRLPPFQGIMMIRRNMLDAIKLKSSGRGWSIVTELIIKAGRAGYRIVSVPTQIRLRASGRSKVNNAKTILANLGQTIALCRYL